MASPKKMFKKRVYRKKGKSVKQVAYKALALAKKNIPELKYAQSTTRISSTVDYTGSMFLPYRYITQASGDINNRIGDRIRAKNLSVRMSFYFPATLTNTVYRVVAFVYKKNTDQLTTASNTILNFYMDSLYHSTSQAPLFTRDWDNRYSFKTLYDRTFYHNKETNTLPANKPLNLNIKIPSSVANVQYQAGGTVPVQNELIVLVINDKSVADMFVDWNFRLTYTDA